MPKRIKLCLLSSAGGHLTELMQLESVYRKWPHFFVTFRREDSANILQGESAYFIKDPKRNPVKLAINMAQSLRIALRERPAVIITTGAGVAIPLCIFGKLLGAKVVFIESFCRIREKSLAGRLLYPIADLFLVQWEELSEAYGGKALYMGAVL
ncbi:MAG: hypothetical protein HY367_02345 [Candidatus Aenigmarchaeota archaeon]|nr:hypothetical protein [Candidatus Aenigmarchaeota archaeon]